MLLGLVTHGVLPYTATGVAQFPIRDQSRHIAADACYFAVHDFRMQLFFLLAGFAGTALASRRGVGGLLRNRLARVAVPMMLAMIVIGPAMHRLFAAHTEARGHEWIVSDAGGWVAPSFHLWFLYYLLLCCVPLAVLISIGRRIPAPICRRLDAAGRWFLQQWWNVPALAALAVPVLWDMPAWWIDTPRGWRPDLTIYVYYLGFFLAGALLYRHQELLPAVGRRWYWQLACANLLVLPIMLKLTIAGNWAEESVPGQLPTWLAGWKAGAIFLGGLYTWLTITGLLGLFQRHCAGTAAWWRYLADASYWCYLAGFPIQAAFQVWFAPSRLPIAIEFLLINGLTFLLLLATYETCVRHTWVGQLLNGKRPPRANDRRAEAIVVTATLHQPHPVPRPAAVRDLPASSTREVGGQTCTTSRSR